MSAIANCIFCGAAVDPYATTTFRKEFGWAHPRSGGGTNALACSEKTDEYACYICINKKKQNIDPTQPSLI